MKIDKDILYSMKPGEIYHIFDSKVSYSTCIHKILLIKTEPTTADCITVDRINFYNYSNDISFGKDATERLYSLGLEFNSIERIKYRKIWYLLLRNIKLMNLTRNLYFNKSLELIQQ